MIMKEWHGVCGTDLFDPSVPEHLLLFIGVCTWFWVVLCDLRNWKSKLLFFSCRKLDKHTVPSETTGRMMPTRLLSRLADSSLFGKHLLVTNTVISGSLMAVGDSFIQKMERMRMKEPAKHNWFRTGTFCPWEQLFQTELKLLVGRILSHPLFPILFPLRQNNSFCYEKSVWMLPENNDTFLRLVQFVWSIWLFAFCVQIWHRDKVWRATFDL